MNAPPTVSVPDAMETDTIDETYAVSNGEFLLAVFGEPMSAALADARPVVVSFGGNPASAAPKAWFGRPWLGAAQNEASPMIPESALLPVIRSKV